MSIDVEIEPAVDDPLAPKPYEMKALEAFRSPDETRENCSTVWCYDGRESGFCFVATDGHTMLVRRSGACRTTALRTIAKDASHPGVLRRCDGKTFNPDDYGARPPAWDSVFDTYVASLSGHDRADFYSWNPAYLARIEVVESAARKRAVADWVPASRYGSKKQEKKDRAQAGDRIFATMRVPPMALDPLYFRIESAAALWEGLIMPRRT